MSEQWWKVSCDCGYLVEVSRRELADHLADQHADDVHDPSVWQV